MSLSASLLSAATVDYVPFAVITLRSAKKHCSFKNHYIFVADAKMDTLNKIRSDLGEDAQWIKLFGPDDIGPMRKNYLKIFNYYNPFEVSQLAKYVGVAHALKNEDVGDICVFIDSDTYFFNDIHTVIDQMGDKSVLMSPHMLTVSEDAQLEHETMIHGWINTGFSIWRARDAAAEKALDWMMARTAKRAFLAPHLGLSGDQTWGSALPFMFPNDVIVDRTPGLNVAYWNLIERKLSGDNLNKLKVNGDALLMFHYSGYSADNGQILSKHAADDIAYIKPGSPLELICDVYKEELVKAKPWIAQIKTYDRIACVKGSLDTRINACMKHVYENKMNFYTSMPKPGVFTKVGSKVDGLLRRIKRGATP